jgi:hypothetical protein
MSESRLRTARTAKRKCDVSLWKWFSTTAGARKALNELLTKRENNDLPILRRSPKAYLRHKKIDQRPEQSRFLLS